LDEDGDTTRLSSIKITAPGAAILAGAPQRGSPPPQPTPRLAVNRTGTLQPGQHLFSFELTAGGGNGYPDGQTQCFATWDLTLDVYPAGPEGADDEADDFRWKNGSGGSFAVAANWEDQHVPVKDLDHRDNAIFDLRGAYTVDFADGKKALGPQRHANRLELLGGMPVFLSVNMLVDELDLVRPSLRIDNAVLTIHDGQLTSNSAAIGDASGGSGELVVDGSESSWTCQGRLRIGGDRSEGTLTILNGADVTSVDTRIGAGAQTGAAAIEGAGSTWNTDNVHVGFSSFGFVSIHDGAKVVSAIARVGGGFPGENSGDRAFVTVSGVDNLDNSSEWAAQSIELGDGARLNVRSGALVNAFQIGVVRGATLDVASVDSRTHRPSSVVCEGLVVGSGGTATIQAGGSARVVDHDLVVGLPTESPAALSVQGVDTESGVASLVDIDAGTLRVGVGDRAVGIVVIKDRAKVTSTHGLIGTSGGFGQVHVYDAQTSWSVGDLVIGDTEVEAPNQAWLDLGPGATVDVAGDFTVHRTGEVFGDGTVKIGGEMNVKGTIGPHVVVLRTRSSPTKRAAKASGPPEPSTLTIQGNLVLAPEGVIQLDAAGTTSDRLVVAGTATLDGTLVLQFENGFAPHTGDAFELFHADGGTTGAFASVTTRGLAPGAQFDVDASGGTVKVTSTTDAVALPTVSIKPAAKRAKEKSKKPIVLTFVRSGDRSQALTVPYAISGSAENGIDCATLTGTVTIPARKKSAKVTFRIVDDSAFEGDETLVVTVLPGEGSTRAAASTAEVTIVDND
jgi:T5SS/PEP-CTERM-associated repeat protein